MKFNFINSALFLCIFFLFLTIPVSASQTDIAGPAGSGTFGDNVTVLPNGNFVVVDTGYDLSSPVVSNVGAVYLYDGATLAVISTLTGSTANDAVGNSGITVLTNGNFVVRSPNWDNPSPLISNVGAVTWCSAAIGCNGVVSSANSLIGSSSSDRVGSPGVVALTNGNYVVRSQSWSTPLTGSVGAVTWGNGTTGTVGVISAANSLIGSTAGDQIGNFGVTPLTNGNYVVISQFWDNPSPLTANVGAVTWGNGTTGTVGMISAANSLIGGTAGDEIGSVTALTNGNYVVRSSVWDNPTPLTENVGAITWGNGTTGTSGVVSAANSLIGDRRNDSVGDLNVTTLTNGNYVVGSSNWNGVGAATWGNGTTATIGVVSAANSLIGASFRDFSSAGITPLTNGNYVVNCRQWDNPSPLKMDVGAVTWGNGTTGTSGVVSAANSLIGGTAGDLIGTATALPNGNYVVSSPFWDNPSPLTTDVGVVTWCGLTTGCIGTVNVANSLIGGTANDRIGLAEVTVLTNGNYVVSSPFWDNPSPLTTDVGAVTWCTAGCIGTVNVANSLIGGTANDRIGNFGVSPLSNGNYVVRSSIWDNPTPLTADVGAITWGNGTTGTSGVVSAANSLIGGTANDNVGGTEPTKLANGNYIVRSSNWDNSAPLASNAGAVTYGNGNGGTTGLVSAANSVVGTIGNGISTFSYDALRNRVFVGRGASNIVSILFFNTTATADGTFSNAGIWDNGLPDSYTNAVIPNGRTVTLDSIANVGLVSVGCTGAIAGASATKYNIGSVQKDYCAATSESFNYPIGDPANYSPMSVANLSGTGSLLANVKNENLPGLNPTESASRFWRLSGSGITTNLSFTYVDGDINGSEASYKMYKRSAGITTAVTPFSINTTTNTITATGISGFSDWAAGNRFAPTAANAGINGRVTTASGRPIRNVTLIIEGGTLSEPKFARTNSFGYYRFQDVEVGQTYIMTVASKRYTFANPTRGITLNEDLDSEDFVSDSK